MPWHLAPVQVGILTVDRESLDWAKEVEELLLEKGLRVTLDKGSQSLQQKMLEASKMKIPYAIVVGRREAAKRVVSARSLKDESDSEEMSTDSFIFKMEEKRNS